MGQSHALFDNEQPLAKPFCENHKLKTWQTVLKSMAKKHYIKYDIRLYLDIKQ